MIFIYRFWIKVVQKDWKMLSYQNLIKLPAILLVFADFLMKYRHYLMCSLPPSWICSLKWWPKVADLFTFKNFKMVVANQNKSQQKGRHCIEAKRRNTPKSNFLSKNEALCCENITVLSSCLALLSSKWHQSWHCWCGCIFRWFFILFFLFFNLLR